MTSNSRILGGLKGFRVYRQPGRGCGLFYFNGASQTQTTRAQHSQLKETLLEDMESISLFRTAGLLSTDLYLYLMICWETHTKIYIMQIGYFMFLCLLLLLFSFIYHFSSCSCIYFYFIYFICLFYLFLTYLTLSGYCYCNLYDLSFNI